MRPMTSLSSSFFVFSKLGASPEERGSPGVFKTEEELKEKIK